MLHAQRIDDAQTGEITADELVRRAAAFSQSVAARAYDVEQTRQIPEETVQEMEAHGLTGILRPRRWGGLEADWRTFVDTVAAGSRGCGSSGWLLSLFNSHSWLLAQFPEAAQQRVWSVDPQARIASSFMPTGKAQPAEGGIRLSGRWQWSSGVDRCGWVVLGVMLPPPSGNGAPRVMYCLVERKDFTIVDTWRNAGLRGTGSNDVIVDDVFIADDMMVSMVDLREGNGPGKDTNPNPIYSLPMYAATPLSIAAPALGIAQGARETWIESTRGKISSATGELASAQAALQIRLADADAEIDLAEMLLHRVAEVLGTGSLSLGQRYRNRRDFSYAIKLACSGVDKLFQMGGARGLVDSSPLQRAWRDLHTASCHVALTPDPAAENWGRNLLGLERNQADLFY